jgi:hypothetical protein
LPDGAELDFGGTVGALADRNPGADLAQQATVAGEGRDVERLLAEVQADHDVAGPSHAITS